MLQIREFTHADSHEDLTSLLHRAYAKLGAMGLNYTAVDQAPQVTAKRVSGGHCFVAELSGQIVGTVVIRPTLAECQCEYFTRAGVAMVCQFGVEPDLQGQGIGSALLRACEKWASDHGYQDLALDTADQANHLLAFYDRHGYALVGHVQWPGKSYRSVVLSKRL